MNLSNDNIKHLYELGEEEYFIGNWNTAIDYFQKIVFIFPDHVPSLLYLGRTYQKLGSNYAQTAIDEFNKAIQLQPDNTVAHYMKGFVLLYDLYEYENAIICFQKVLELDSTLIEAKNQILEAEYMIVGNKKTNVW